MMNRQLPSAGARILAALCALILTACLSATLASLLGVQILTSRGLHERAALSTEVVDLQMRVIEEKITALAEKENFNPKDILSLVTREEAEALDRKMAAWWMDALENGKMAEKPEFDLKGAREKLLADEAFVSGLDEMMISITADRIVMEAQRAIQGTAVQYRDSLVEAGLKRVRDQISLPKIMELLKRVPLAGAMGCLLAAGLIALLMSRKLMTAGQYIGGAMGAAGLLCVLAWFLLRQLNLQGMISEASEALSLQTAHLRGTLDLEILGTAAGLLLLGTLLMIPARKEYRKYGG